VSRVLVPFSVFRCRRELKLAVFEQLAVDDEWLIEEIECAFECWWAMSRIVEFAVRGNGS
jgi:hypothetical protein